MAIKHFGFFVGHGDDEFYLNPPMCVDVVAGKKKKKKKKGGKKRF